MLTFTKETIIRYCKDNGFGAPSETILKLLYLAKQIQDDAYKRGLERGRKENLEHNKTNTSI